MTYLSRQQNLCGLSWIVLIHMIHEHTHTHTQSFALAESECNMIQRQCPHTLLRFYPFRNFFSLSVPLSLSLSVSLIFHLSSTRPRSEEIMSRLKGYTRLQKWSTIVLFHTQFYRGGAAINNCENTRSLRPVISEIKPSQLSHFWYVSGILRGEYTLTYDNSAFFIPE